MKYGRSSEQLDRELVQMQLSIEDLEASLAAKPLEVRPTPKEPPQKPAVGHCLPSFPERMILHENPCACPDCGGKLRPLGEDVSEMLEYVPSRFKVIRHVRPKLSCASMPEDRAACWRRVVRSSVVSQARAPCTRSGVQVLRSLPLYRQSQIYAREGSSLIARPLPTGWAARVRCSSPW
jgi:transposase